MTSIYQPDPRLDLTLERVIDVPPDRVWAAWTQPEQLKPWFTPAPWSTVDAEIDLRPGGIFRTVMRSPEGQDFPNLGCYLEVVPNERLAWTNTLLPGFRPAAPPASDHCGGFLFTAVISLAPEGTGTRYRALVIHGDEAGRARHEELGFSEGWNAALDQLVAYIKSH